jgi:hypothetical protein
VVVVEAIEEDHRVTDHRVTEGKITIVTGDATRVQ